MANRSFHIHLTVPDTPHVYAEMTQPDLRFEWESINVTSYTVRWKKETDARWQERNSSNNIYIFDLEQNELSFGEKYEFQIAANAEIKKTICAKCFFEEL